MDQDEIVAYKAIVSVDLRGAALQNRDLAMISVREGNNGYDKTGPQEIYPLACFRLKTVQVMGGS